MKRFVCLLVLLLAGLSMAQDEGELAKVKERELEAVRDRISALKESMDEAAAARDRVTGELQSAEVAIAEKRLRLREIERERDYSERRKAELDATLTHREAELEAESSELAAQVRSAYMSGSQERLRLLLSQKDPAMLGRLLVYYDYLNEFRAGNIDKVTGIITELMSLRGQVAAATARLDELAKERYAELTELNTEQEKRQALLAELQDRLTDEGAEVQRLAVQEQDLARLITELTRILSDYPITSEAPFGQLKGKLTWPVSGQLVHDFGQPRSSGGVKWNGVVLATEPGREVRAVYHGRVVFADWLAGMGLLVIVSHGDDFLTLYGYNETILKNAGDWVAPGDVIATVGDSGGQSEAGLYFEIREGTRPVNPRQWVTRRPGET